MLNLKRTTVNNITHKFLWLFSFIFSLSILPTYANPHLEISKIQIVENLYSKKVIKAFISYDGNLGNANFIGAQAQTNVPVSGAAYHPYRIKKGTSEIQFSITRPPTNSLKAFQSQSILFTVYNSKKSIKKTIDFEINWPSFETYFSINEIVKNDHVFTSITSFSINENLSNSKGLTRDMLASGVEPDNVNIISSEAYNAVKPTPCFIFSETLSFEDFEHLTKLLTKNNIALKNLAFTNIDDPKFKMGSVGVTSSGRIDAGSLSDDDINLAIKNRKFDDIFKKIAFSPTPVNELNKRLLDKAISLNNESTKKRGEEAKEIAEYLINIGYDHSRIYAELARAYGRIYNFNDTALKKRKSVLNLALSINPKNQWAHALLVWDETSMGNFASAEKHAILAKKYEKEKNIWTIVNWGRLYEKQGRLDDAKAKYAELLGQSDLNDSNVIAHKRGLNYYGNLLASSADKDITKVYRELISAYPDTVPCTKVKLAHHIVINSKEYSEARTLLNDPSVKSCEDVDSTKALVDLRDWYKSGASGSLHKIIIKHGDLTTLIYEVASMPNAHLFLQSFSKNNIELSVRNQNGLNALHLAVALKNEKAIANMLNEKIDINSPLPNGWTSLMIATYVNSPTVVKILLANGADKALKTPEGYSAMTIAKEAKLNDIVKLLENTSI